MGSSPPTPPPRYTPTADHHLPLPPPPPPPPRLSPSDFKTTLEPHRPGSGSGSGSDSGYPGYLGSSSPSWLTAADPRSSSTQSLLPPESIQASRRKLLVIYIHGFLGNDQSFRHFPAHVHSFLSSMLADTHVIHSKIYPRYKTYRAVEVARDNFSQWLEPHEGRNTDVVLLGHSMGGILAADVILMPGANPRSHALKHRIIGHISLDCPFLGLHPGIIVSGISSLFKPSPQPGQTPPPQNDALSVPDFASPASSSVDLTASSSSQTPSNASFTAPPFRQPTDPFFNSPFWNDSPLKEQPFVKRMMHFANKYQSEGIVQAAARHVLSYLEFGSCLADPRGLEIRYLQVRALEDVNELQEFGPNRNPSGPRTRVRFANYYTVCTGLPKTLKEVTPKSEAPDASDPPQGGGNLSAGRDLSNRLSVLTDEEDNFKTPPESNRPSIQIDNHDDMAKEKISASPGKNLEIDIYQPHRDVDTVSPLSDMDNLSLNYVDPSPIEESDDEGQEGQEGRKDQKDQKDQKDEAIEKMKTTDSQPQLPSSEALHLPPIPSEPTPPTLPDPTLYSDRDARKQAEREAKRLQKAYDQAVKDRTKALRERDKLLEKRQKKAQKDAERLEKAGAKESQRLEREAAKEQQRLEKEAQKREKDDRKREAQAQKKRAIAERDALIAAVEAQRPPKLRRFCNLPGKVDGVRDPTWVRVFMADLDEVGAHCGLFVPGPQYDQLVGDVGSRIVGWVQEDLTKRTILEMTQETQR